MPKSPTRYAASTCSVYLAMAALDDFQKLSLERYPHDRVLERTFELRHNASIDDALYIALAKALPAELVTMDRALAPVPNVGAKVEVIA